ncbi:MAG: carbamoyltransferase C-terminal domain-containing protein, partial [Nanoarchaeota archaeon]|nr:carbamoyltransferase C-terminal domain-containing protein [Nanoarchaeota archaeon]
TLKMRFSSIKVCNVRNTPTGVSALLNTSFNVKGEPIVCTPRDALRTFYSCGLDFLVIGDYIISKKS